MMGVLERSRRYCPAPDSFPVRRSAAASRGSCSFAKAWESFAQVKPDFGSDRKQKWLTHFAAVTSADAPVNYGDFLLFTALELAISSFTAAVDESELPDGLGKWWNKMLKTKAVAALKGKGKKLMPGEHNKAW